MSQEPITVVEYDSAWPARYEAAERRIREAAGEHLEAVEHVGSTAVPGLAAKPIVDVQAGVATLSDADDCITPLEAIGWEYVPELEELVPERRYFRRTNERNHTHHLHVVELGGDWWERHLLFRDFLRDHPDVAAEYGALKRDLAAEHRWSVADYGEAKTEFVRRVEERARDYYHGPR